MAARVGTTKTPAQMFALVFGVVYLLVGIVGFFITGFDDFAGETFDDELIVFALNPLHNIVHIALGAVWLASAARHDMAKAVNMLLGVVLLVVFVLGMVEALQWLAIEDSGASDNYLHLATALLAIYFGSAGAGATAAATTTDEAP
jgi:hypothetical protein